MHLHPIPQHITPQQINALQRVFDEIVAAPWFRDTEDSRRDMSDLVMRQFRRGATDPVVLLHECEAVARARYSA